MSALASSSEMRAEYQESRRIVNNIKNVQKILRKQQVQVKKVITLSQKHEKYEKRSMSELL
ncbi:hypothetical protein CSA56_18255 [candidate division KSB3 bacterium]|uniref:Uncharacterized protein n=1 Tax=candidate division KSB3 bacterium TaxID=2044937 RepID=A0A2G6K6Z0_9BACT|nr:MAG: hypothetical protein CSA56_18255 [candidate division KSB3 bacterium]